MTYKASQASLALDLEIIKIRELTLSIRAYTERIKISWTHVNPDT